MHSLCRSTLLYYSIFLILTLISPSTPTRLLPMNHDINSYSTFTTELIHRDSRQSPIHNPSKSKWEHFANAITRSHTRANHFSSSTTNAGGGSSTTSTTNSTNDAVESSILYMSGEYLMNISIGTPPVTFLGIVDTGSDLIWTQCQPCENCYNQTHPTFNPNKSSSFKHIPCTSHTCHEVDPTSAPANCSDEVDVCKYDVNYGDKSYSSGDVISETLTLYDVSSSSLRPVMFHEIVVGCGYNNGGTFSDKGTGIIGLGGGSVSLVRQLSPMIGDGSGKFSYCLAPYDFESMTESSSTTIRSSKITFGSTNSDGGGCVDEAVVVTTPLVKMPDLHTFYFVKLVSITVGDTIIPPPTPTPTHQQQQINDTTMTTTMIIVDSGTTLTYLPREIYTEVEDAMSSAIKPVVVERADDPWKSMRLCYKMMKETGGRGDVYDEVPVLKMRFDGDCEIELKAKQTFVRVAEDVVCLAMAPSDDFGILGNVAQSGFVVGFDLDKEMVSFQPNDCSSKLLS